MIARTADQMKSELPFCLSLNDTWRASAMLCDCVKTATLRPKIQALSLRPLIDFGNALRPMSFFSGQTSVAHSIIVLSLCKLQKRNTYPYFRRALLDSTSLMSLPSMEIQDIFRAFIFFSLIFNFVCAAGNNLTTEIGTLPICAVCTPSFFE